MKKVFKETGNFSEGKFRLIIKGFKTDKSFNEFIDSQSWSEANPWGEVLDSSHYMGKPINNLKPGTYVFAGQRLHNVKDLDFGALAHF